ncbi:DUF4354 family protein [Arsenophonus apicola]|uniref:DUF4354 family protein n=1 Tax=Arsenophonus apicola TaxID=2879119 RepID=UPI003879A3C3
MKKINLLASILLSSCCFTTFAGTLDNIIVISTEKSQGSISLGEKSFYTKQFDISLANNGETINLSNTCLKAFNSDRKEFKLDTIDEKLTKGELKKGKLLKGMVVFSSNDESVYGANLVKILDSCK